MTDEITVPIMVKGKPFYSNYLAEALKQANGEHDGVQYRALFMPEFADARTIAGKNDFVWQNWFFTQSARMTGRDLSGKPVVIYAHIPNY